jgi:post-segregation antitoxin (ccd killing protein)
MIDFQRSMYGETDPAKDIMALNVSAISQFVISSQLQARRDPSWRTEELEALLSIRLT